METSDDHSVASRNPTNLRLHRSPFIRYGMISLLVALMVLPGATGIPALSGPVISPSTLATPLVPAALTAPTTAGGASPVVSSPTYAPVSAPTSLPSSSLPSSCGPSCVPVVVLPPGTVSSGPRSSTPAPVPASASPVPASSTAVSHGSPVASLFSTSAVRPLLSPPVSSVIAYLPLHLNNTNSVPVAAGTPVLVNLSWAPIASFLDPNVDNVVFFNQSGGAQNAWLQSGANRSAPYAQVFVNVTTAIPAKTVYPLYLGLLPRGMNDLSSAGPWGEAPQLSPAGQYAHADDGAKVFAVYANGNTSLAEFNVGAGETLKQSVGIPYTSGTVNALTLNSTNQSGPFILNRSLPNTGAYLAESNFQSLNTGTDSGVAGLCGSSTSATVQNAYGTDMGFFGAYFGMDFIQSGTYVPGFNTTGSANTNWNWGALGYEGPTSSVTEGIIAPNPENNSGAAFGMQNINTLDRATSLYFCTLSDSTKGFPMQVNFNWIRAYPIPAGGPGSVVVTASSLTYTLQAPVPAALPTSGDAGMTVKFSETPTGGTLPYSFAWNVPAAWTCTVVSTTTASTDTCALPSAFVPGTYPVNVTVTDALGFVAVSPTDPFQVFPALTPAAPTASSNPADAQTSVTLTAVPSGGSGSYLYSWNVPAAWSCTPSGTTNACYVPTSFPSGTYSISYNLTDSTGNRVLSPSLSLRINPQLAGGAGANVSATDSGLPVAFFTTVSGGTAPYNFTWNFGDGSPLNYSQNPVHRYTVVSSTTFLISLKVSDSANSSFSLGFTVMVNPLPTVAPATNLNPSDSGLAGSFMSNQAGGTGPITYAWDFGDGSPINTFANPGHAFTVSTKTVFTVTLWANDSMGQTAKGVISVTVYPALVASVIVSNRNPVDPTGTVTFTEIPSGGAGPGSYIYSWSAPGGWTCTQSTTVSYGNDTCTVPSGTTAGNYSVYVMVTDGISYYGSLVFTEQVLPPLTVPAATPSANPVDLNSTLTLTDSASGGTGSYTFQWIVPTGWSCTPTRTNTTTTDICFIPASFTLGTYSVGVIAKDGTGLQVTSPAALVQVQAANTLEAPAPVPSQNPIDNGMQVSFTETPIGGTGPYTFSWVPPVSWSCVSTPNPAASSTLTCLLPTTGPTGAQSIGVRVTDTTSANVLSPALVENVYPEITVGTPGATYNPVDQGANDTLSATASGGSGSYTFTWVTPAGWVCTPTNLATSTTDLCAVPAAALGNYNVSVIVADAYGETVRSGNTTLTVMPVLVGVATVSPSATDSGYGVYLNSTWIGGTGPYHFTWNLGDGSGPLVVENFTWNYLVTSTTVFHITVWVNDSGGGSSVVKLTITVNPPPGVTVTASPTVLDLGQSVTFTAHGVNGTTPYRYLWFGLPAGCLSADVAVLTCTPTAVGTFDVGVLLTDHVGAQAVPPVGWKPAPYATNSLNTVVDGMATWDAADGYIVQFGGSCYGLSYPYCEGGNTYAWLNGTFKEIQSGYSGTGSGISQCQYPNNLTLTFCPSPREGGGLAYDPAGHYVVLFGGSLGYDGSTYPPALANDTWVYSHGVWTLLPSAGGPAPLAGFSMVYDPALGEIVLFGGTTCPLLDGGCQTQNLWAFKEGHWTQLEQGLGGTSCDYLSTGATVSCPSSRTFSGMAYDSSSHSLILFGGDVCNGGCAVGDTWAFGPGGNWTQLATPQAPTPRAAMTMVSDTTGGYILLFGGNACGVFSSTCTLGDTWAFFNGTWLPLHPTASPVARLGAVASDWPGHGVVLYGGSDCFGFSCGNVYSDAWVYQSSGMPVRINADPAVAFLGASRTALDVGQSVTLTATVTGGTFPLSYLWTGLPIGCSAGSQLTVTCAPTVAGNYTVNLTVTDALGHSASRTIRLIVSPALGTPVLTALPSSVDVGQSLNLTVAASGGSGIYTYVWTGLPPGCTGANSSVLKCAPAASGGYTVSVRVTDSNGESLLTSTVTITVDASLVTPTVTASRPALDVGQAVTFTVSVAGGSGVFSYLWTGLPAGCVSVNAPVLTCVPTANGTANVGVTVTDSNLASGTSAVTSVAVSSDPSVSALNATLNDLDVGMTLTLSGTVSPGSGSPVFRWTGLPPGCTSSSALSIVCAPSTPGTYSVVLTIQDSNGFSASSSPLVLTVAPDLVLSAAASPTTVDLGATIEFTSSVQGGTTPLLYHWSFGDGSTGTGVAVSHVYTAAGPYVVVLNVTDGAGATVSTTLDVTVQAIPALTVPQLVASVSQVEVGGTLTFSVSEKGGVLPYSFAWNGLPAGCVSANALTLTCSPTTAGSYTVSVNVTDARGLSAASNSVTVTVASPLSVEISTGSTSVKAGTAVLFTASVRGGFGPYSYIWFLNGSAIAGATGSQLNLTLEHGATYSVSVQVSDAQGHSSASTVAQVTTIPPKAPAAGPSGYEIAQLVLTATVLALIAIALLVYLLRNRKKGASGSSKTDPTTSSDTSGSTAPQAQEHQE